MEILKKHNLLSLDIATKFLTEKKFTTRTHLIFNIFHNNYQPENGHLPGQNKLPVLYIWLSKGESAKTVNSFIQRTVNKRVREIHDLTGLGSVPSFLINYSSGQTPIFWNPRTLRKAPNPSSSWWVLLGSRNCTQTTISLLARRLWRHLTSIIHWGRLLYGYKDNSKGRWKSEGSYTLAWENTDTDYRLLL